MTKFATILASALVLGIVVWGVTARSASDAETLNIISEIHNSCDATRAMLGDQEILLGNQNCKGWVVYKCSRHVLFVSNGITTDDVSILSLDGGASENLTEKVVLRPASIGLNEGTEIVNMHVDGASCIADGMEVRLSLTSLRSGGGGSLQPFEKVLTFD